MANMTASSQQLSLNRGKWTDLATQRWVRLTGRRVSLDDTPWLDGPVGDVEGIGLDFFHRLAAREGLEIDSSAEPRGLLDSFSLLAGPHFDPSSVHPDVAAFYENTAAFDLDVWSKWSGAFRPFGSVLAAIFSRRLQQLNVPLSPLDTSMGISSSVLKFRDSDGKTRYTAWVRELLSSHNTLYAGAYSLASVPGFDGPCIRVVFPLPNGSAIIIMRPTAEPDGSFAVHSVGKRFGDPGFYFFVQDRDGKGWARYVSSLKETIRVFPTSDGDVRADHILHFWGAQFLKLHYRMRSRT
ncbi:MAG: hypothetical protein IH831_03405 [Planctomycetes bacterium]|nr:hypothetical protein [Planctomycetota bacterium]